MRIKKEVYKVMEVNHEGRSPGLGGRGGPAPFNSSLDLPPAPGSTCLKPCCAAGLSSGVAIDTLLLLAEEWMPRVARPFEREFPAAPKEGDAGAFGGEVGSGGLLFSVTGAMGVVRAELEDAEASLVFPPRPDNNPRSL